RLGDIRHPVLLVSTPQQRVRTTRAATSTRIRYRRCPASRPTLSVPIEMAMLRLDARAVVAVGDEAHLYLRLRILVLLPVFFNQFKENWEASQAAAAPNRTRQTH